MSKRDEKKGATRCPAVSLTDPLRPANSRAPLREKLQEVKRRSGPPVPLPGSAFSLSAPGRRDTELGAKNSSSSLMKCNLSRPNIIYHPAATVFLCPSVSSVSRCSALFLLLKQSRGKTFAASDPVLPFFGFFPPLFSFLLLCLLSFCSVWHKMKYVLRPAPLDSYRKPRLFFDVHLE